MLVLIFLFYSAAIFHQLDGRKYDIEEECKKLYGENLNKVLKRFRRTPEYLKILNAKMEEFDSQSRDNYRHLLIYQTTQLQDRINELYNVSSMTKPSKSTDATRVLRELWKHPVNRHANKAFRKFGYKKQIKRDDETKPEEEKGQDDKNEDDKEETKTTTLTPIELLDKVYSRSLMTVDERNMFKDMGFEAAGKLIHSLISSIDDDYSLKSTKFLSEGKHTLKTTAVMKHEHEHVVHESPSPSHIESTLSAGEGEEGHVTRFRHHKPSEWTPQTHKNAANRSPRVFH